jgi:hypothetical protein
MKYKLPIRLRANGIAQAINDLSNPYKLIRKPQVDGSSPLAGSTLFAGLAASAPRNFCRCAQVVPASSSSVTSRLQAFFNHPVVPDSPSRFKYPCRLTGFIAASFHLLISLLEVTERTTPR